MQIKVERLPSTEINLEQEMNFVHIYAAGVQDATPAEILKLFMEFGSHSRDVVIYALNKPQIALHLAGSSTSEKPELPFYLNASEYTWHHAYTQQEMDRLEAEGF